jgi:hypothetical protein
VTVGGFHSDGLGISWVALGWDLGCTIVVKNINVTLIVVISHREVYEKTGVVLRVLWCW